MSRPAIEARFIDGQRGRVFVLLKTPPDLRSGRCVLVVPPFAEEMNKSRALFADLAHSLANQGVATLLVDLYGTGDSEGEFRDADRLLWCDDLQRSIRWAASQGWAPTSMVAVRLGCILGAEAVRGIGISLEATVLWQPVLDGKRFLTQFLRLRVAASMMSSTGRESAEQLRALLRDGRILEVAGYEVTPALADQLETMILAAEIGSALGRVHWLELVRDVEGSVTPASQAAIDSVRGRGIDVRSATVLGEPFWSSTEIVRNDALIARTVQALSGTQ